MLWKVPPTLAALLAVLVVLAINSVTAGGPPSKANATLLGPNVFLFDPKMPAADIQRTANDLFRKMEANEFGSERYALLFKPGKYDVTFNVGFYTQVAGLGQSPDDVKINGGVNVSAEWKANANATCNFWRSLENFAVTPTSTEGVTRIAVSQAAPLRRLHVKGNLHLFAFDKHWNAGWASGGYLADSLIDGEGGKTNGYASYKVADTVTSHEAWGIGVYSFFRDAPVKARRAIEAPAVPGVKFHHLTTVWLTGQSGSEITHIINDTGGRVHANSPPDAMRQTLVDYPDASSGTGAKRNKK